MVDLVQRRVLSEEVAAKIKQHILDNSLRAGDRLPTEYQLAERFGVSRVSIREATKALAFLGIIRAAPRRGLTVGTVQMSRVTEYLGFHLAMNDYPKERLLQSRMVIEIGAVPYAGERMRADPAIAQRLLAMTDQLAGVTDEQEFIDGDVAFHRALLDASGLEPLVAFGDLLQVFFIRFRQSVREGGWASGVRSHRTIVEALAAGDVAGAQGELTKHLEYHKGHL